MLQQQPAARDGRAVAARRLGCQALERVGDHLAEERLGIVVADRALLRYCCGTKLSTSRIGTFDALLADVRELDEPAGRQLLLDAEAVTPVFGLMRSAGNTLPGALPRLVRIPSAEPTGSSSWPLGTGIGQVGLEGQAVVARHRYRRVARVAKLIDAVLMPGTACNWNGAMNRPAPPRRTVVVVCR